MEMLLLQHNKHFTPSVTAEVAVPCPKRGSEGLIASEHAGNTSKRTDSKSLVKYAGV